MKLNKQTLIDRLIDHKWITGQPVPMDEITEEQIGEQWWVYHRNYGFFFCTMGSHEVVLSMIYMLENLDEFIKIIEDGLSTTDPFRYDEEYFMEEIEGFSMDGWGGDFYLDDKALEMKGTAYVSSIQSYGNTPIRVGKLSNLSPYERRFFGRYFTDFREMNK